ncbi:histone-like nucleoid-structuring protein Lsr2 [Nocardia grenadensis]|uniref:histone-like nucleoid-structuring protein Lsr2 n=1 Tax=Nocardia grenadensis TaxID=931537 RepID=UPI0007A3A575|nr:Lsr2 family protein [Nocardia grenadensis]
MARRVVVTMVDDLDGESVAAETVSFGVDGLLYEIDLSEENAREFRAALDKWVPFARRVGKQRRAKGQVPDRPQSAKTVREWARRNGHEIPDRGRIPGAVLAAYQRAAG